MARNATAFQVLGSRDPRVREKGAYYFTHDPDTGERVGIVHACPCGCGSQSLIWFAGNSLKATPVWSVSGEWPKVTLSPSIGVKYDGAGVHSLYHWHGFLEHGVFVER